MAKKQESMYWATVRKGLAELPRIKQLHRIENEVGAGMPDVCYLVHNSRGQAVTGFLELKLVPEYPKRDSTPLDLRHLNVHQIQFMRRWHLAGGRCGMLLRVAKEDHFLLPGSVVHLLREAPHVEIPFLALRHWKRRIEYDELYQSLTMI